MLRRALLALVAACIALSAPAAALADNAGDNQYVDPFANGVPQSSSPKKHKTASTPATSSPAPATSSPAPAQTTPTATTAAAGSSDTLPRTGFPLLPVAAIGAALVAAGLALRRIV